LASRFASSQLNRILIGLIVDAKTRNHRFCRHQRMGGHQRSPLPGSAGLPRKKLTDVGVSGPTLQVVRHEGYQLCLPVELL